LVDDQRFPRSGESGSNFSRRLGDQFNYRELQQGGKGGLLGVGAILPAGLGARLRSVALLVPALLTSSISRYFQHLIH
jgi:hypothetical protein